MLGERRPPLLGLAFLGTLVVVFLQYGHRDVDRLLDGEYTRIDIEYVVVREVTYDYHEQNFSVRELNDEIYYTRYPEPEPESSGGLFATIRGLF